MKKNMLMLGLSVMFFFSAGVFAQEEEKFDVSKYDNVYDEYVVGKIWQLDYKLSKTNYNMPQFSIKVEAVDTDEPGNYYRRYGYVRGIEMGSSKFIEVKELPENEDGFLYTVFDANRNMQIEKVKFDEEGRLVINLINDDILVFNHEELRDNDCRTYESKMECLMRTDPDEYLRIQDEQFRKESKEANKSN